jgi:hypothetical protein
MGSLDHSTVNKIKQWVSLDNKVELKKMRLKEYTDERKALEDDILSYVENNNKKNLQINTSDGYIDFHDVKTTQIMTLKYIKDALESYFASDQTSPASASTIYEYLLNNRDSKTKTVMRRHITS